MTRSIQWALGELLDMYYGEGSGASSESRNQRIESMYGLKILQNMTSNQNILYNVLVVHSIQSIFDNATLMEYIRGRGSGGATSKTADPNRADDNKCVAEFVKRNKVFIAIINPMFDIEKRRPDLSHAFYRSTGLVERFTNHLQTCVNKYKLNVLVLRSRGVDDANTIKRFVHNTYKLIEK